MALGAERMLRIVTALLVLEVKLLDSVLNKCMDGGFNPDDRLTARLLKGENING